MNNQILDNEALQNQTEPIKKYREKAILLEAVPILFVILCLLTGSRYLVAFSSFLLVMIYLLGGWYIFKGDQYRAKDIIFATLSVLIIYIPIPLTLVGITIKGSDWDFGNILLVFLMEITLGVSAVYMIICILWYLFHRNRPLETRFSLKLLSRVILLTPLLTSVLNTF